MITQLFAIENTKLKAKQKGNIVIVKTIIKSSMLTPGQAQKKYGDKNKADFITHIWAKVGDNIVFDVSTSPYLSKNPLLKFKYNYEGAGDTLELVTRDNNGREVKTVKKIKSSSRKNSSLLSKTTPYKVTDYTLKHPNIWKMTTVNTVLDELYGSHKVVTNSKFHISTPIYTSNPYAVPVTVKGEFVLESFVAIAVNNPQVVLAIFTLTPQSVLDYSFKVKLFKEGKILIIGKGNDGKLYKASTYNPVHENIALIKERCIKGNAKQCNLLANSYTYGHDSQGYKVERNKEEADRYRSLATDQYAKACELNDFKQCYQLGLAYDQERGREKSLALALFYFKKACNEGGDAQSCRRMAELYPNRSDKSSKMYEKACELGSPRDCYDGAESYKVSNLVKAKELYQKACDLGGGFGCQKVAILYLAEKTNIGNKKAITAMKKSCYRGSVHRPECIKIAQAYETGTLGVIKNKTRAKEFYQKACSTNLPEACVKLGTEPLSFLGKSYKDEKSKLSFERQCKKNDYWACYRLADIYQKAKNIGLAKKYYTKSCSGDYYQSCYNLAHIYRNEKNYKKAIPLYSKVCDNDSYNGCSILGHYYSNEEETSKNLSLALQYYEKACVRGDSTACNWEIKKIKKMMLNVDGK